MLKISTWCGSSTRHHFVTCDGALDRWYQYHSNAPSFVAVESLVETVLRKQIYLGLFQKVLVDFLSFGVYILFYEAYLVRLRLWHMLSWPLPLTWIIDIIVIYYTGKTRLKGLKNSEQMFRPPPQRKSKILGNSENTQFSNFVVLWNILSLMS